MKAEPIHKEKRILLNKQNGKFAIAELKIWKVPKTKDYPKGIKYSLFLVCDGEIIIGIDNHRPKGHHLHLGSFEYPYDYHNEKQLLEDFWSFARKAGFNL